MAGNDVSIASGNNVNIEGTVSQAGRCLSVAAANNLTIQSALSTVDQKTSFQSESASVGVSAGVGLTGFSLAGNASVGFQTGDSSMHQVTNVMSQLSGGAVTLKSGGNTTVAGATVTGGTVTADVGGNLSVESRQDTLTSRNSQTGFSLGIGIGLGSVSSTTGPGSYAPNTNFLSDTGQMFSNAGSFLAQGGPFGNTAPGQLSNVNNGNTPLKNTGSIGFTYVRGSEDKAWTDNLTTINGTSGTTLNVAGNTNVKGAVIESSGGGPLAVNTSTFTYQNIQDYDRTQNINASFNVTIPLGSFGWQQNAPSTGGTPASAGQPANAPPPPTPSMLAQLGQGLAQAGQTLGKYPAKFQLAYTATDKEGITYATVGAGSINVSDTAKQAALESSGATGALAKLNRDVTKTQVITKNTTEAFNIFVSTQSLGTIATLASKAIIYIDDMVSQGKLLPGVGGDAKKVLDYISKYGMPATICDGPGGSGGATQSGWLFNLRDFIIAPAYADGVGGGCQLYFRWGPGITANPEVLQAYQQAMVATASQVLTPENIALFNTLQAASDNGTITPDQQTQLNNLKPAVYAAADVFALCGTANDLSTLTNLLSGVQSTYNNLLLAEALDFRRGGDIMASQIANKDPAALQFWNQYNVYPESTKTGSGQDAQYLMAPELTAVFLLKGIDGSNTPEQNSAIIQLAFNQLSGFTQVPQYLSAGYGERIQAALNYGTTNLPDSVVLTYNLYLAGSGLVNWAAAHPGPPLGPDYATAPLSFGVVSGALGAGAYAVGGASFLATSGGMMIGGEGYVLHQDLVNQPITAQGFLSSTAMGGVFGLGGYAWPLVTAGAGSFLSGWSAGTLASQAENYSNLSASQQWAFWVDTGFTAVGTAGSFAGALSIKSPSAVAAAEVESPALTAQGLTLTYTRDPVTGQLAWTATEGASSPSGAPGWWRTTGSITDLAGEPAPVVVPGALVPQTAAANSGGLTTVLAGSGQLPAFFLTPGGIPAETSLTGALSLGANGGIPAVASSALAPSAIAPAGFPDVPALWTQCCFVAGTPVKTDSRPCAHRKLEGWRSRSVARPQDGRHLLAARHAGSCPPHREDQYVLQAHRQQGRGGGKLLRHGRASVLDRRQGRVEIGRRA